MTFSLLDDEFHAHPKVVDAGNAATGLYVRALSYCGAYLTDGFVSDAWARSAGTPRERRRLEEVGLWTPVEGGYSIPDYLDFNPSRDEVEAKRAEVSEKRSKAGKRGARARWADGKPDGKAMANGSQTDGPTPLPLSSEPKGSSRQRDELWDILSTSLGEPATKDERKRRGKVVKELREAGATVAQVTDRVGRWRAGWPEMTLTDTALLKHWTTLATLEPQGKGATRYGRGLTASAAANQAGLERLPLTAIEGGNR